MTTYYAAPNASGSGLSASSPFTIANFLAIARSGDVLNLLGSNMLTDGLYQGSANLIQPNAGLDGITIQALNDGGVLLDGQFTNLPIFLRGNNNWLLQGFNARNGNGNVCQLGNYLVSTSNSNTFRRMVMWDGNMTTNTHVFMFISSSNNLVEDCAFFGAGRNVFHNFGTSDGNIARRVWARWEGSTTQGGKLAFQMDYAGHGLLCENCIGTWSAELMPESYLLTDPSGNSLGIAMSNFAVDQPYSIFKSAANPGETSNLQLYDSLAYLKPGDATAPANWPAVGIYFQHGSSMTLRHAMTFISPSHPEFNVITGIVVGTSGESQSGLLADHLSSVRGAAGDQFFNVTATNSSFGTQLAKFGGSVTDPWTTAGAGANLCFRWVNGVVTTTPLWPWPMRDRIKAATAAAGAYGGPCVGCPTVRSSRVQTDMQADIETLLGAIPSQCIGGGVPNPPPTPPSQNLTISNSGGGGATAWTASKLQTWLMLSSSSGVTPATISLTANPTGLANGTYHDTVTVTLAGADNTPQTASVTFTIGSGASITAAQTSASNITVTWSNIPNFSLTDIIQVVSPAGVVADSFAIGTPPGYVTVLATGANGSLLYAIWADRSLTYSFHYVQNGTTLAVTPQTVVT